MDTAKELVKELKTMVRELASQVSQGSPVTVSQLQDVEDELEIIHGMLPTPESVGGKPYPPMSAGGKPGSAKDPSEANAARGKIDTDVKSPTAAKQDANEPGNSNKKVTGK